MVCNPNAAVLDILLGWLSCRCITTLQSNMLRQLVSSSLQDYLSFLRQHAVVHQLDPQQDKVLWSCLPVFETELVAQDGKQHAAKQERHPQCVLKMEPTCSTDTCTVQCLS